MTTFAIFLFLIILVSFLLIVVIMVQNPKGGGLSSSFGGGGGTQLGGVKKTTDFLDKSTWTLAGLLLVLILFSNIGIMGGKSQESKVNTENIDSGLDTNSSPIEDTEIKSNKTKSDKAESGEIKNDAETPAQD